MGGSGLLSRKLIPNPRFTLICPDQIVAWRVIRPLTPPPCCVRRVGPRLNQISRLAQTKEHRYRSCPTSRRSSVPQSFNKDGNVGRSMIAGDRRARLMATMADAKLDALIVYGNAWQGDYLRYATDFGILEGQGLAIVGKDGHVALY